MRFQPLSDYLRDSYVHHLALDDQVGPPSVEALTTLHRAHLDRVPYENIEIQVGRPTSIDPTESADRFLDSRGGYCYHLNGAFGALLTSLGYDVSPIRGAVPDAADDNSWGNHLVLLVELDTTTWVADVGLGDGFRDPIPLRPGTIEQPPFTYELSQTGGTRWRFDHDKRSTITGFDFDVTPVKLSAFIHKHAELSTSPTSPFQRVFVIQSRRADHALTLRGCVFSRVDADGRSSRDVTNPDEWLDILMDEFDVRLTDSETRDALWHRVRTSHDEWDRAGRP